MQERLHRAAGQHPGSGCADLEVENGRAKRR